MILNFEIIVDRMRGSIDGGFDNESFVAISTLPGPTQQAVEHHFEQVKRKVNDLLGHRADDRTIDLLFLDAHHIFQALRTYDIEVRVRMEDQYRAGMPKIETKTGFRF